MKRLIAILLAVMVMTAVFTACSGTAYYDDGMGYGNVSTTPNGRVNGGMADGPMGGMFGEGGRGNYGGSSMPGTGNYGGQSGSSGMTGGQSGSSGMTGSRSNGRGMGRSNGTGSGMSNGSMGTGMTGSR